MNGTAWPSFPTAWPGRFVMVRRTQVPMLVLIQNVHRLVDAARDGCSTREKVKP